MNSVAMNSALLHGFKRNNVFPCALSLSFLPSVGASLLVHFLAIGFVRCREGEGIGDRCYGGRRHSIRGTQC